MSSISCCEGSIERRVQTVPTPRSTFHGAARRCIFERFGLRIPMPGHPQPLSRTLQVPLEDELGDVLEKAMSCAGLSPEALAEKSGVAVAGILDAIDYRPELSPTDCGRLAAALGLNEVGLCALATGKYPLPDSEGLPFRVWPLRMAHGIGVVNAYIVAEGDEGRGLLFDAGPDAGALESVWPHEIRGIDGIFITHIEAEHAGGLCGAA